MACPVQEMNPWGPGSEPGAPGCWPLPASKMFSTGLPLPRGTPASQDHQAVPSGVPWRPKRAGLARAEESKFTSGQSRTRVRLVSSVRKRSSAAVPVLLHISPAAVGREACRELTACARGSDHNHCPASLPPPTGSERTICLTASSSQGLRENRKYGAFASPS